MPHPGKVSWPDGQHFALTYEIPDNFGGLTTAMLRRSRSITQVTGEPVQILTLGLQPHLDQVRDNLVARSLLHEPQLLRNMWEEIRDWDDAALAASGVDPDFPEPAELGSADVDVHREDGSLLARQRWIASGFRPAVTPDGDAVSHTWLWAADGRYLGGWPGTWDLWRHWIAVVTRPGPAHLMIDSATVADAFAHATIDDTAVSVVIHNNHLDGGVEPPYGALGRWRRHLIEQRDGFDALVFLTERQRTDAELLLGPIPNAHVVPNLLEPSTSSSRVRRDVRRGVALASLDPRKRLDHAVKAMSSAGQTSLHIYGSGPRKQSLRELILATNAPVVLEGQTSDPAAAFAQGSYSVLTSSKEGLPLVLAESMRAGCVPISYDVPYGPSDVITDGVDGYLVPMGDHTALGKRIAQFLGLSRWKRRAMRQAAKRRAGDFAPRPILERWATVLEAATTRRATRTSSQSGRSEQLAYVHRFCEPRLDARLVGCTWTSNDLVVIRLDLRASVEASPSEIDLTFESIEVDAVHVPTGTRTRLAVKRSSEESRAYDVTLDLDALAPTIDHVVLVTAHTAQLDLTTTVRDRVVWGPWSSAPAVSGSGSRPVLTLSSARGLSLTMAKPKAVGHINLGSSITITAGSVDGQPASSHELTAPGCDPIVVPADGHGTATLPIPGAGRWRVRSEIAGRMHDVAWAADPADVPGGPGEAVQVRLTPRGYVRLEVSDRSALIRGLEPTSSGCAIVGSLLGQSVPHVGSVAAVIDGESWRLDLGSLTPGVHPIRGSADGSDAGATPTVQELLPQTVELGERTITLRRSGRKDAYEVAVTAN